MIEIKIPKEIRDFKSKVIFNLTARQVISVVIALVINVPLYIFSKGLFGEDIAGWLIIIISAPIFLIGFVKKDGMNYEKYFLIMLRFNFLTPRIRKYKTENIFTYLNERKRNSENERAKATSKDKGKKVKR